MPPPGSFMPATSAPARGRSNNVAAPATTTTAAPNKTLTAPSSMSTMTSTSVPTQLTLSTRRLSATSRLSGIRDTTNATISPMSDPRRPSHSKQSSQSDSGSKIPASEKHSKLHKRGCASNESQQSYSSPFATHKELTSDASSSGPKIKPYLRKMSTPKEDQGLIDLSKSTRENDRLAGLGIQDFGPRTVADVSFTHNKRGQQHGRNMSNGSNNSNGSGNFRAQPFVHPMAKTPRPYTPPSGISHANSLNDEEADESDDIVEHDFHLGNGFRSRRSTSLSSTPQLALTPLSQSHTASELGLLPKSSTSQSNLSLASNHSDKSAGRKPRSRRNTDVSSDYISSPIARTSFDKAFSLVGRKSESTEPQSREDLILAARRKFEEKEANKDRKYEQEASRKRQRQERQRRQSDAPPPLKSSLKQQPPARRRKDSHPAHAGAESEKTDDFRAISYEAHRPAHSASLPTFGTLPGESEKVPRLSERLKQKEEERSDGGWLRFSTWVQTRMLSCGGSRA